jgi:hypothetical protein
MPVRWPALTRQRLWLAGLSLVAGLAAAPFGYDVGLRIAGPLIGWIMALNVAVFCTLIAAAALDALAGLLGRGKDRR